MIGLHISYWLMILWGQHEFTSVRVVVMKDITITDPNLGTCMNFVLLTLALYVLLLTCFNLFCIYYRKHCVKVIIVWIKEAASDRCQWDCHLTNNITKRRSGCKRLFWIFSSSVLVFTILLQFKTDHNSRLWNWYLLLFRYLIKNMSKLTLVSKATSLSNWQHLIRSEFIRVRMGVRYSVNI